jgi:DedD protein
MDSGEQARHSSDTPYVGPQRVPYSPGLGCQARANKFDSPITGADTGRGAGTNPRALMHYTSQASMEQRGAREVDRWKDKIEVRLDNRQVAFLFFGSALVACLLFVLGVIVGKRLESRGRALAPEFEDPLALLDRVASTSVVTPRREETVSPPAAASRPRPPARTERPPTNPASSTAVTARPVAVVSPAAPAPASSTPAPKRPEPVSVATVKEGGKPKARFMLQIGSFPDKAEAEAFAAGFVLEQPIVVISEVPDKGTWYRVRFGDFQGFREAVDAKLVFEKRHNKIALVVGPL